jgi:hypothetical protein
MPSLRYWSLRMSRREEMLPARWLQLNMWGGEKN